MSIFPIFISAKAAFEDLKRICWRAQPQAESTDTHIFNGNLFRIYIFFCFYFSPSSAHALPPPDNLHLGKTIRREESFFNSHIHTRIFSLLTPPNGDFLLVFREFLMFVLLLTIRGCEWAEDDGKRIVTISHILITFYCFWKYLLVFHLYRFIVFLEHLLLFRLIWKVGCLLGLNFSIGESSQWQTNGLWRRFLKSLRNARNSNENPQTKTHKMEIEKHYTSNCEKIVKCGWWTPPCPLHRRPDRSDGRQKFYFVALLLSISHFQGATLDIHKFGCRDFLWRFFEWAASQATPQTCTLWCLAFVS